MSSKRIIYNIGDIITYQEHEFLITKVGIMLNKNTQKKTFIYDLRCKECGYTFKRKHGKMKLRGCPCCSKKTLAIGFNDIATIADWMVPYFQGGYEEASHYTPSSNKTLYFQCPDCGKISKILQSPNRLNKTHSIGCTCSDGISYPEKVMISILEQLKVDYIFQATTKHIGFDAENYRYDFFIPSKSCIIEVHGKQHYIGGFDSFINGLSLEQEQKRDKRKEEIAQINGIKYYIVIDCRKSMISWIKDSVMNSILPSLFYFTEDTIKWEKCSEFALNNLKKDICLEYKEQFAKITELAKKYNLDYNTITKYLKYGNDAGWCDFTKEVNTRYIPVQIKKNDKIIYYAKSTMDAAKLSLEKIGIELKYKHLNRCLAGKNYTHRGYMIEYVPDIKRRWQILNDC